MQWEMVTNTQCALNMKSAFVGGKWEGWGWKGREKVFSGIHELTALVALWLQAERSFSKTSCITLCSAGSGPLGTGLGGSAACCQQITALAHSLLFANTTSED